MPVIALNFEKIYAVKLKEIKPPVDMKTDINILELAKKELPVGKVLQVNFGFKVVYSPKIAELELEGHLYHLGDEKEIDRLESEWKKKKTFTNPELMSLFVNTILLKCNIEALLLEREIGLPAHIRLPIVAPAAPSKKVSAKRK